MSSTTLPSADDDPPRPPAPRLSVMRTTPAGPVHVQVWPAGDDDASRRPVLLCLHGWTDSGLGFGPLATALGRRWTVVAPDAPGHGSTPWQRDARYRVADHAAGVLAVLDALPEVAGRRADIVALGHSLGALTASRVAAARPDVVRHLVLEEPARSALRRTPSAATVRARVLARRAAAADGERPVAVVRAEHPDWPDDELAPRSEGTQTVSLDALSVPVAWGEPLVALLADVPCPVTLVRGWRERGASVTSAGARRCAAACRAGCDVVALDCGHHPRREAREPFVAVVAAALGRLDR